MKEKAFETICGNCVGVDISTITPEDIRIQAKAWADQGEPCDDETIDAAIAWLE